LKRFQYRNNSFEKLRDLVKYPLKDLDLSQYVAENVTSPGTYELYSVTNHVGSVSGGHYTSYVLNNNEWVEYDDERVTILQNLQHLVSEQAYLLFYRLVKPSQSSKLAV
jgi:ubiquitin C-terminal hydrolase